MNRFERFFVLVLAIAVLAGCSSKPPATASKKAALDRIQGKMQVLVEPGGAADAAMNAGGPSLYLWEGTRRYRLFVRTPVEVVHGREYIVEGVYAQKMIDELGDPDQGRNGYPLQSSCDRVISAAWSSQAFDIADGQASLLRSRIKRYPARPVFLVTKLTPVDTGSAEAKKVADEADVPEVSVPAEKQRALLIEGPTVHTAPLWEPAGGTVTCKVIIGPDGKVSELETGAQLCEAVPWSQFRYQPTIQRGRAVKVKTEVEVRFEPRK
jgi:hypothetical protein